MAGRGDGAASSDQEAVSGVRSDAGRYQIFATLGRGGMAEVFLALARGPRGFNKLVVLKRLRPHLAEEASFREMFLDEARLAARLNHPNVVQSYEVGEGNGSFFIAMEYLDGQPLNRILEELRTRRQRIDPGIAARIIADACSGLGHAHELRDYDGTPLRIIHRDVSPHNIFVNYDGQVKLVDFGIAKAVVSRAETEVGVLKGKISYMAPEQAAGGAIDARADIFAMGIVLWELVAARQLFQGENAANILHKLMNDPIPAPSTVAPGIDPKLEAIVMRALDKDPNQRFASARELRTALEEWLRATGRGVRGDDVAGLVTSLFEGVRATVQGEIKKHMASVGAEGGAQRAMSFASIDTRSGDNLRALVDLGPQATAGAASGLSRKVSVRPVAEAPGKRRRALVLIGIAAAVLFAVTLVVAFRLRRPEETPAPVASVVLPAAPSAPALPVAAPPPSPPVAPVALAPEAAPTAPPTVVATARHQPSTPPNSGHSGHVARPAPPPIASPPPPAAVPEAAQGFLTLDTYPWTRVSENGRALGTTPIVHVALPAGTHVLALDNPDLGIHQTYQAVITSGATLSRSLGLR